MGTELKAMNDWDTFIMKVYTWCACPCGLVLTTVAEVRKHFDAGHFAEPADVPAGRTSEN